VNEFDMHGRRAVVTGAGRGIGREIAATFAEAGATLAVADIDGGRAETVAGELRAATDRPHAAFEVDVTDATRVRRFAEEATERMGGVDTLVNNAGIARHAPAEEMTEADWDEVMAVNLTGAFTCAREFGRRMLEAGGGSIVNIASMSGLIVNKPQPQVAYNVSKAGVIMLTKSLAAEWADRHVRVNAVSPGYIGTEMTKEGLKNETWSSVWLEMTPTGRVGEPGDIALAVRYLASDAAKYVTGTNLVVDGGYTLW
jgi:NAD(P)-dependent dehydrogenase (short-subunit alcohol dehydrogenase family)